MDLKIWDGFGRFEWFYKRKGNSMPTIRVYIFGKGFPQATASLATCYNAVEGSYPPKSNNKVRKLDWHSIDVRRPSIGVQPSNNVRTLNGGQPWPGTDLCAEPVGVWKRLPRGWSTRDVPMIVTSHTREEMGPFQLLSPPFLADFWLLFDSVIWYMQQ